MSAQCFYYISLSGLHNYVAQICRLLKINLFPPFYGIGNQACSDLTNSFRLFQCLPRFRCSFAVLYNPFAYSFIGYSSYSGYSSFFCIDFISNSFLIILIFNMVKPAVASKCSQVSHLHRMYLFMPFVLLCKTQNSPIPEISLNTQELLFRKVGYSRCDVQAEMLWMSFRLVMVIEESSEGSFQRLTAELMAWGSGICIPCESTVNLVPGLQCSNHNP
jgi:hypothetical protein